TKPRRSPGTRPPALAATATRPTATRRLARWPRRALRVEAARQRRFGHAADRQHVCRHAQVGVVLDGRAVHIFEAAHHDPTQPRVDLVDAPEELFAVLDSLEVADRDAAGVAQDVGDNHDAALVPDVVGLRVGTAVGRFGDDPRPNAGCVAL